MLRLIEKNKDDTIVEESDRPESKPASEMTEAAADLTLMKSNSLLAD